MDVNKDECKNLNLIQNATSVINEIAYDALSLSKSFYGTGNSILGDTLAHMSYTLLNASKEIDKGTGGMICDDLRRSEESLKFVVGGILKNCLTSKGK